MSDKTSRQVKAIRTFSRYYTNILGLLNQHILESDLSLSEVRVLHEIDKCENCTSAALAGILCLDPGYLSRTLKHFEQSGLLIRQPSPDDRRAYLLRLTDEGKQVIAQLNGRSDRQIEQLIAPLSIRERAELVKDLTSAKTIWTRGQELRPEDVTIRTELKPGDAGSITAMHGRLYQEEYGYSLAFEGYVAASFSEFLLQYDPARDHLWCAEHDGNIVGCIGIVGHGDRAQLRWFLVDPLYRGLGLGRRLLTAAMDFVRQCSEYRSIYLDTTSDLHQAIGLYERLGFQKVKETPNSLWREGLMELEYSMELAPSPAAEQAE
ncbi:MAG: GNAT family N-acetyltransferase [Clostridiales bacterium]|nr:GNAT family N-acetyltransferase [Clostridiales bacterium]